MKLGASTQVGDVKSQRLALWMVEDYLKRNVLIFDPEVFKELFKEADFKGEGSLDMRSLSAAISGETWLVITWHFNLLQ